MASKLDDFIKAIGDKITDMTNLNIQTVMGGRLKKNEDNFEFVNDEDIQGIISKIDLIDGDIKTQITEEFYKSYPELVQFHQAREVKGHEIIDGNIRTLKTMWDILKEFKFPNDPTTTP